MPESEVWSVEEGCRKARLGVWRKGAGKRGLECGGRVQESEAWDVEEGCRKARLGVCEVPACPPDSCQPLNIDRGDCQTDPVFVMA